MKNLYFLRLKSFVIDFFVCFVLPYLFFIIIGIFLQATIMLYFRFFVFFLLIVINTTIAVFSNGQTIGMKISKLQLGNDEAKYFKLRIFFKEFILKWGLFFILPLFIAKIITTENFISLLLLLFVIYFCLNSLSYLISKKTIVDIFSKTNVVKRSNCIKKNNSFIALIIDFAIIFSITIVFDRILLHWIFINSIFIFGITTFLYYLISYTIFNKTFGKRCMRISVVSKNGEKLKFKGIAIREVSKILILFCLPALILYFCGFIDFTFTYSLLFIIIDLAIILFSFGIKNEYYWDAFAKTEKFKQKLSKKVIILNYSIIIVFLALIYGFFVFDNNTNNVSEQKFLGFNLPFKFKEYPNNSKIKPYTAFLSENNVESPKDYILGLFENNDIVILCETLHGEDTQWDMISDIVSDERFINNVGNIFTEYGYAKDQENINKFLFTTFPNDTLLEKAAATLMHYRSCFYFFMLKLNKLNQNLPDSLKIIEHFTDMYNHSYLLNYSEDASVVAQLEVRDSLMANIVIDWYRKTNKKCLVVTNNRHAFAVKNEAKLKHPDEFKKYFTMDNHLANEAQFIYNCFPNKTANVLINNFKVYGLTLYSTINNGKWETAFKQNNLVSVGFNFNNTPFGEDNFDMSGIAERKNYLKYQDIFTGLVFYKPHSQLTTSSPLYEKYGAEQEYKYLI
ncbi:MAG: RDD family protein, partial [Bacteroidales bacterium]|nr:RDD family protein [Bacteroidales bacterium]